MSNALKRRVVATLMLTPAANYAGKEGYMVTHDGVTATISTSATVPATAVILEGGKDANSKITVGILGALEGSVDMKTSGVIAGGARVQQAADGTIVTDAGPGNARVVIGVSMEAAACASGDLIEVAPLSPMILP